MRIPRNLTSPQRLALLWIGSIWLVMPGCIHLNIPSVRYGEHPTPLAATSHGEPAGRHAAETGFCGSIHGDPSSDMMFAEHTVPAGNPLPGRGNALPPPPEVPWPRFHPLPTRPVYGR